MHKYKIIIIIKWVSHYRFSFYESLKKQLWLKGIELDVIYGEPISELDRKKKDWVDISWGKKINNVKIINDEIIWQPVLSEIKNADLIIVEQANKLLLNYYLQFKRLFSSQKIAFWGHGRNFQVSNNFFSRLKEKVKKILIHHIDWWFAYNNFCAIEIELSGYPKTKITRVENAIDTAEIKEISLSIKEKDLLNFKNQFKINGSNIGVYCGGMFVKKRIPFLLSSAIEIKKRISDFELVFIGGGLGQKDVEDAVKTYSWIHYTGPLFGKDKIIAMMTAKIYLMPGLIGLGVLDAFAIGLPVLTTDYEFHSPEISYVEHGKNGIVSKNNKPSYIYAVSEVLLNDDLLKKLKKGSKLSSEKYTVENMTKNFSEGILRCLKS